MLQDCYHQTRMICECKMWIERSQRMAEHIYSSTGHRCCRRCRASEKQCRSEIEWQSPRHYHQWAELPPMQGRKTHDIRHRISIDQDNDFRSTAYQQAIDRCTTHREPRLDSLQPCGRVYGHEPQLQKSTFKISNSAPKARQGRACSVESGRCDYTSCAYA